MGHLLYLMFRCDFDVMESLESLEELEGTKHSHCSFTVDFISFSRDGPIHMLLAGVCVAVGLAAVCTQCSLSSSTGTRTEWEGESWSWSRSHCAAMFLLFRLIHPAISLHM